MHLHMERDQEQRGFTLIEIMVAVGIIGVLSSVAIPMFMGSVEKSKSTEATIQLEKLAESAKLYFANNNQFPQGTSSVLPGPDEWRRVGPAGAWAPTKPVVVPSRGRRTGGELVVMQAPDIALAIGALGEGGVAGALPRGVAAVASFCGRASPRCLVLDAAAVACVTPTVTDSPPQADAPAPCTISVALSVPARREGETGHAINITLMHAYAFVDEEAEEDDGVGGEAPALGADGSAQPPIVDVDDALDEAERTRRRVRDAVCGLSLIHI